MIESYVDLQALGTHQEASDLFTTPLLEMHGLIFNRRHGLLICASCCVGLPLNYAATHLSAGTVETWDDDNSNLAHFRAEHPMLVGVETDKERELFKNSLIESLISHKVITSQDSVLDGFGNETWRDNGENIFCTDETPIQGVRINPGYRCKRCPCVGRSLWYVKNHKHHSGTEKGLKARPHDVLGPIHVQTFSEIYRLFYEVKSYPIFLSSQVDRTQLPALQLLENEQAQMLKTLPDVQPLGPELRTLPPIFRDGGIESWLRLSDRRKLSSMLPQIPAAFTQKKTSLFSKYEMQYFSYLRRILSFFKMATSTRKFLSFLQMDLGQRPVSPLNL